MSDDGTAGRDETDARTDETDGRTDGTDGRTDETNARTDETNARTDGTETPEGRTDADPKSRLTHTDETGTAGMVNVGDKPDSERRAVAVGAIHLQPETISAVRANELEKGDVTSVARIGATRAVKHTWEAVPLCHQIPITGVDVSFELHDDRIECRVAVETTGKTGCEMEALQGVTGGLTTVWDMVKASEKTDEGGYPATRIENVRVIEKRKS